MISALAVFGLVLASSVPESPEATPAELTDSKVGPTSVGPTSVGPTSVGSTSLGTPEEWYAGNACVECHRKEGGRLAEIVDVEWAKSTHYENNVPCESCHGGDALLTRDDFASEEEFKRTSHLTFNAEFLFLRDRGGVGPATDAPGRRRFPDHPLLQRLQVQLNDRSLPAKVERIVGRADAAARSPLALQVRHLRDQPRIQVVAIEVALVLPV